MEKKKSEEFVEGELVRHRVSGEKYIYLFSVIKEIQDKPQPTHITLLRCRDKHLSTLDFLPVELEPWPEP